MHLALLAVGLVAYWPLTSTRDSISGLDLTKVGKVQLTGHGADFRGGYLAQPNLTIGPDSYSVTMWANPDTFGKIALWSCGGQEATAQLTTDGSGTSINFTNRMEYADYPLYGTLSDLLPAFGWQWHFYAFTYNASTFEMDMYVDGERTATVMWLSFQRLAAPAPFLLGPSGFTGGMKNVGLWDRCLDYLEIRRQWNGGLGLSLGEL